MPHHPWNIGSSAPAALCHLLRNALRKCEGARQKDVSPLEESRYGMNTHLILHDSSLYEKVQSAEWKHEWIEDRE